MPLVPFPADALPVTDGQSVAVWQRHSGSRLRVVRDGEPLSSARLLPAPACSPAATDGARLATDCAPVASVLGLVDLRDGAEITSLPVRRLQSAFAGEYARNGDLRYQVEALGRRLVRTTYYTRTGDGQALYDLVNGGPAVLRPLTSTSISSLDTGEGRRHLCAPLHVSTHRTRDPYSAERSRERDVSTYRARRLVLRHGGEVRLKRCGQRGFRVLGRATAMTPVLTRRYVAWLSTTRLYVFDMRTGRRRSFPVTRDGMSFGPPATLAGIDHRLWVLDAKGVRVLTP